MHVFSSENLEKLEKSLGYSFRNRELLGEALTHKSYHHEQPRKAPKYNERLEFLGDSVLALVIVEHIFRMEMEYSESLMSKIKSYLVRGSLLSEIAADLSLGHYIRLGKGEEDTGGRRKKSILADALEAVFGTIYLDGGYENARQVILSLFGERIAAAISSGEYLDYKTELQERSQMLFGVLPEYRVVGQDGDEHLKMFTVEVFIEGTQFGKGVGRSKKEAETLAAKEAMERLGEQSESRGQKV
jgi:ribonuclease-3